MTSVWSCGGGTQSAAIAALIVTGRLPKPDIAVIVDTEREKETTWFYYQNVLRPQLWKVGVMLQIVKKSEYATVDLYRNDDLLIPAYTTQKGRVSKMPTFCSNEWKQRVVRRWLKEEMKVTDVEMWIGISRDEMERIRVSDVGWIKNRYPLIFDVPMRRIECSHYVQKIGWPEPPRSACWMCPNMRNAEWDSLTENDREKATQFEKEIQAIDPHVHLRDPENKEESKQSCMSGMCFV